MTAEILSLQDMALLNKGQDGNLSPFGRALREWLGEDEQLLLLPGYGWLDGGCLILAEALCAWANGLLKPAVWMFDSDHGQVASHYSAKFETECGQTIFIDGDGLNTAQEMKDKLDRELHRKREHWLSPDSAQCMNQARRGERPLLEANLPGFESTAFTLAIRLSREFGPLEPDTLGLDMLDEPGESVVRVAAPAPRTA